MRGLRRSPAGAPRDSDRASRSAPLGLGRCRMPGQVPGPAAARRGAPRGSAPAARPRSALRRAGARPPASFRVRTPRWRSGAGRRPGRRRGAPARRTSRRCVPSPARGVRCEVLRPEVGLDLDDPASDAPSGVSWMTRSCQAGRGRPQLPSGRTTSEPRERPRRSSPARQRRHRPPASWRQEVGDLLRHERCAAWPRVGISVARKKSAPGPMSPSPPEPLSGPAAPTTASGADRKKVSITTSVMTIERPRRRTRGPPRDLVELRDRQPRPFQNPHDEPAADRSRWRTE